MSDDAKREPAAQEAIVASPSRLGREVKIGVTLILALLVLLAVAIVRRLTATNRDGLTVAAAGDQVQAEKENPAAEPSSCDAGNPSLGTPNRGKGSASSRATIVPPKAAVAKPPKAGEGDLDPWKLPDERSEGTRRGNQSPMRPLPSNGSALLPPPIMPELSSATASSPPEAATSAIHPALPPTASPTTEPVMPGSATARHGQAAASELTAGPAVTAMKSHAPAWRSGGPPPPWPAAPTSSAPQPSGAVRTYTVAQGDSLFSIARRQLGKASRWAEIYDLNRDALGQNFSDLPPGTRLVLPRDEPPEMQARQPDSGLRR